MTNELKNQIDSQVPVDNDEIIEKDQDEDKKAKKTAIRNTSVLGVSDEERKQDDGNGMIDIAEKNAGKM